MRQFSDSEIRNLWAKHFPKRLSFCFMVELRAARHLSGDEDLLVKVHETLVALGIPREDKKAG